ncbi:MAG: PBP1A family penicillin-binding protein [Alphaproteobacteria bacterium]|nr:PBP1A family penicillin-binding protein [Alphaproteobacteria bacterium]
MSETEHSDGARQRSVMMRLAYWGLVAGLWSAFALGALVFYYALDLPDTDDLWRVGAQPELSIYARDEGLVARRGRRGGRPMQFDDFPPHLVEAVIAIEDRRFFLHFGLDPRGLIRAALVNLRTGRLAQGGSTLTQQLAKNVFLTPERSFKRKVQELLLAFWLEAHFSKQDIIALYLNRVYFGSGAYGVQSAAETYFNRPVQNLTQLEAAMLAGLLQAPSRYAPTRDPQAAAARARVVIAAMQAADYISAPEAAALAGETLVITNRSTDGAHYAVDWTLDQLPDFVGRPRADLDVMTTLDRTMQLAAERAINRVLDAESEPRQAGQAAMVVMTPDGGIRAMVGGRTYGKSQFNRAVQARRQPGSAFKPVVYLAALENGLVVDDVFDDAPLEINGWSPKNYDGTYRGDITAGEALARSLNTVAVQVSEQAGRDNVIDMARRLGLSGRMRAHPSLALGAFEVNLLQLTAAYAHFANGGRQVVPHIIQSVISGSGQLLYNRLTPSPLPIVEPSHIASLNRMLRAAMTIGTGRAAAISGVDLAGKTGTSQNWRDAWFIGYSGALVVGVWVGNDDGASMNRVTGGGLPAQIFNVFMTEQKQLAASVALPDAALPARGGLGGLLRRLFGD